MSADTRTGQIRAVAARTTPRKVWQRRYAHRLMFTDFLVILLVVTGVQILWLGVETEAEFTVARGWSPDGAVGYGLISAVIILWWMAVLSFTGTRRPRVIGVGTAEYKAIADGGFGLFAVVVALVFFLNLDVARGYLLLVFPVGILFLILSRWYWRKWLAAQRERGHYTSRVLLAGSAVTVEHVAEELIRNPGAGYEVVGACLPSTRKANRDYVGTVPVVGSVEDAQVAMKRVSADTVVLTGADELGPQTVRELSWNLDQSEYSLVVAPSLTDISGPRIHVQPVAGLPLIQVETPRQEGVRALVKRAFDIGVSGVVLLILAVPMLLIAAAIKITSRGPVLFCQERVGHQGKPFTMLKFRSMAKSAESQLDALDHPDHHGERPSGADHVLFKMKQDPRVTGVGRLLRRYSLDELPQLLNVLTGSMSLVGPRPSLMREVELYEHHVHRRFLVKPGMTGLWQVSGRSDLPWEEAVRLDLYYVENWSLTTDLIIVWRTGRAVLRGAGAY